MINIWNKDCNHIEIPHRNSLHVDSVAVSSSSYNVNCLSLFLFGQRKEYCFVCNYVLLVCLFCFMFSVFGVNSDAIVLTKWRHRDAEHVCKQLEFKHASPPPRSVAMFWHYWRFNPQNREKICTCCQPIIFEFRVYTVGVSIAVFVFDIYVLGNIKLTACSTSWRPVSNRSGQKDLLPFEGLLCCMRLCIDSWSFYWLFFRHWSV